MPAVPRNFRSRACDAAPLVAAAEFLRSAEPENPRGAEGVVDQGESRLDAPSGGTPLVQLSRPGPRQCASQIARVMPSQSDVSATLAVPANYWRDENVNELCTIRSGGSKSRASIEA